MPEFTVAHAYRSSRDGQPFGPWKPGDVVELLDADAEWVNRDSPGCLLTFPAPASTPEAEPAARAKPAGRDRQHRGGANRGA
jgi:hypothetical protein